MKKHFLIAVIALLATISYFFLPGQLMKLGWKAYYDGKYNQAEKYFGATRMIKPNHDSANEGFADSLVMQQKLEDAERIYVTLVNKSEYARHALFVLVDIYLRLNKIDDADVAFQRYASLLDVQNEWYFYPKGLISYSKEQYAEAEIEAQKALSLTQNTQLRYKSLQLLVGVYNNQGRFGNANKLMEDAMQSDLASQTLILFQLAKNYEYAKNRELAQQAWATFIKAISKQDFSRSGVEINQHYVFAKERLDVLTNKGEFINFVRSNDFNYFAVAE